MGLDKTDNSDVREYGLDEELDFGKFKGCTPREIIDDQEGHTLQWYCDNIEWFFLDNEAYDYMSRYVNGL